jgi:hypothetical protein
MIADQVILAEHLWAIFKTDYSEINRYLDNFRTENDAG